MSLPSVALQFPFTLYQTKNTFDDYDANDMRYGDLSEHCLKGHYNLKAIVEGIDPWNSEVETYPSGNYAFSRPVIINQSTNHREIAKLLFDHFRRHSWLDKYNGLSVSIHDVYATQITIESLYIDETRFRAKIHYKGQDHFGLDVQDIMNLRFHHIPIFRIWFVLQRWEKFGFKPFMTNMSATLDITGERNR